MARVDYRRMPGSPFRFKANSSLKTHESRKKVGDGVINKKFATMVPKVSDPEIKDLVKKYPLMPYENKKKHEEIELIEDNYISHY